MEFKHPVAEDLPIYEPHTLARFIENARIQGLKNVAVKERTGKTSVKAVNQIKLDCQGDIPVQDTEEIVAGIMRCCAQHYADHDREGKQPYAAIAFCQDRKGETKRIHHHFMYNPEEADSSGGDREDLGEEDYGRIETINALLHTNDRLRGQNELAFDKLIEMTDKLIEMTGKQERVTDPLMHMMAYMGQLALQGWHNSQRAMELIYSHETAKIDAETRTAERAQLLDFAKPAFKTLMDQGGMWMLMRKAKELGLDPEKAEEMLRSMFGTKEDEPEADEKQQAAPTRATSVQSPQMHEGPEHPIAFMARAFWAHLSPDQVFSFQDALTKKENAMLRTLVTAKTDDEAVAAYEEFATKVPDSKLAKLGMSLEKEQMELLEKLAEMVSRTRKAERKAED